MQGLVDVLRLYARRGALTVEEIDEEAGLLPEDYSRQFLAAVDECADRLYIMEVKGGRRAEPAWRLSPRGRRMLKITADFAGAA